jgi:uncharacterized membrane protein
LTHSFVGTLDGQYTSFDYGTGDTEARAISNDGYVAGDAFVSDGSRIFGYDFVRAPNGSLATIMSAKKNGTPLDGVVQGIATKQNFVGESWTYDGSTHETAYFGKGSTYRAELDLPFNTDRIRPRGLANDGTVVGYYRDLTAKLYPAFVLKDGVATAIQYSDPNAYYTYFEDLNDKGLIAGGWGSSDGFTGNAFLFDMNKNAFKLIQVPGSTASNATGINKNGIVIISSDIGSFIYCPKKKNCPVGAGAIEIADRWIKVPPQYLHTVVCQHGCLRPSGSAVTGSKPNTMASGAVKLDADPMFETHRPFRQQGR